MSCAAHLAQVLFICVAVVAWWGKALLFIPPQLTWPFSKLLAFPHASNYLEVGAVTVLPWVAMCDRLTNLLARVVFPEQVSVRVCSCDCSRQRNSSWHPATAVCGHSCRLCSHARLCLRQALDLRTKPLTTVLEEPELQQ